MITFDFAKVHALPNGTIIAGYIVDEIKAKPVIGLVECRLLGFTDTDKELDQFAHEHWVSFQMDGQDEDLSLAFAKLIQGAAAAFELFLNPEVVEE